MSKQVLYSALPSVLALGCVCIASGAGEDKCQHQNAEQVLHVLAVP